jgi:hypothetical protein
MGLQKIKTISIDLSFRVLISLVLLKGGRIAVGLRARERVKNEHHISIYSIETGECEQVLQGACASVLFS